MTRSHRRMPERGFSLIEIIVCLVLLGFLGAVVVNLRAPLVNSTGAVNWVKDEFVLKNDVERMIATYAATVNSAGNNSYLQAFQSALAADATYHIHSMGYVYFDVSGNMQNAAGTSDTLRVVVSDGDMKATLLFTNLVRFDDPVTVRY